MVFLMWIVCGYRSGPSPPSTPLTATRSGDPAQDTTILRRSGRKERPCSWVVVGVERKPRPALIITYDTFLASKVVHSGSARGVKFGAIFSRTPRPSHLKYISIGQPTIPSFPAEGVPLYSHSRSPDRLASRRRNLTYSTRSFRCT
jgi:hypothetical protein